MRDTPACRHRSVCRPVFAFFVASARSPVSALLVPAWFPVSACPFRPACSFSRRACSLRLFFSRVGPSSARFSASSPFLLPRPGSASALLFRGGPLGLCRLALLASACLFVSGGSFAWGRFWSASLHPASKVSFKAAGGGEAVVSPCLSLLKGWD